MSRRWLLALLLCALAGCRPGVALVKPLPPLVDALADPPRRPDKPLLFIAMPDSPPFRVVRRSLVEELQGDFDFVTTLVPRGSSPDAFALSVERHRPKAVVVMDNPVLALYRRYAASRPAGDPAPPAVAVMTSFLDELTDRSNTTGITYEVPGVTAFVQLRSVIARPVRKVAVLHRPKLRGFIERQARLAAKEQIKLVPIEVSADPSAGEIRAALNLVVKSHGTDALWVLNDNGLLRDASFLEAAWRPALARLDMPVVVGLPSLVVPEARFGNFAVVPDHEALGVQAAQLIYKLAEEGWRVDGQPIEPAISTVTIANLPQLKERFGLREGAAERVDQAVE